MPGALACVWAALSKCHLQKRWERPGQLPSSWRHIHSTISGMRWGKGRPGLCWEEQTPSAQTPSAQTLSQDQHEAQQASVLGSWAPQMDVHFPFLNATVMGSWAGGSGAVFPLV